MTFVRVDISLPSELVNELVDFLHRSLQALDASTERVRSLWTAFAAANPEAAEKVSTRGAFGGGRLALHTNTVQDGRSLMMQSLQPRLQYKTDQYVGGGYNSWLSLSLLSHF